MARTHLLFLSLILSVLAPACTVAQEPLAMEELGILVGCWEGGMGDVAMREQWTDAEGGVMLGTTRYLRDGVVVDYEFARIEQTDSAVVLWPYPRGERSPRGFPLVGGGEELVFENLEHDFPVRIIYHRVDANHLAPRIEGRDGDARGWELTRVTCPGG